MPWLPLYLAESDVSLVMNLLAQDPEIAFLVPDGPRRWRAVKTMSEQATGRIGLWHIPSGPLPLLSAIPDSPDHQVQDPWSGWTEERTGANPHTPYFGPGHPGIVWLNLHTTGREPGSCCGLSSFEWIGNHYRVLGNAAAPSTEMWWKSLRRRVAKLSEKVPRRQLRGSSRPEIFALPSAYRLLVAGGIADANP